MLATVEFGRLGMIQGTLGMFEPFDGMALGITTTKYVAEFRQTDPSHTYDGDARAAEWVGGS